MANFNALPLAESCRRIDFDRAEVLLHIPEEPPVLRVEGNAPCMNMTVALIPRGYVDKPEYWKIEVVGCLPGGVSGDKEEPYEFEEG